MLKKRQKDLLMGLNVSNVPDFKSAKMEKTRFSDLNFRLGAGYLYCHQVLIYSPYAFIVVMFLHHFFCGNQIVI